MAPGYTCFLLLALVSGAGAGFANSTLKPGDNCLCSCCGIGSVKCPYNEYQTLKVDSKDRCTIEMCAASIYTCPDAGSHNEDKNVEATYYDCACECCQEDTCPRVSYHAWDAGSAARCNAEGCAAHFYSCPDTGSHNDDAHVKATYLGEASPPGIVSDGYTRMDDPSDGDCVCACCKEGDCPEKKYFTWYAGGEDRCTSRACSSKFYSCPDLGVLPEGAEPKEVTATYYDCTCACCTDTTCPTMMYNIWAAGSPAACNPEACAAKYYICPDTGSHNTRFSMQNTAIYSGPQQPPSPPPATATLVRATDPGNTDCECQCCATGGCANHFIDRFTAGSPEKCTEAACEASFYACPDSGSHNAGAEVIAIYHNCICDCCLNPPCRERHYYVYTAQSSSFCSADRCRAQFYGCPDTGSHHDHENATVIARFTGKDTESDDSSDSDKPEDTETEKLLMLQGEMLWILMGCICGLVVVLLCVIGLYCKQQTQGYKWVMVEDIVTKIPETSRPPDASQAPSQSGSQSSTREFRVSKNSQLGVMEVEEIGEGAAPRAARRPQCESQ